MKYNRRLRCEIVSLVTLGVWFLFTILLASHGLHDELQSSGAANRPSPHFANNNYTASTGDHSDGHRARARTMATQRARIASTNAVSTMPSANCNAKRSFDDIVQCVPETARLRLTGKCATSIESWDGVQRCLNGPRPWYAPNDSHTTIRPTINLIGERNSGTKWIVEEMQKCFPLDKYGIKIQRDLWGRSKHFFQEVGWNPPAQGSHVVIAIFRDPVEWVAAMIEKPYHMPAHMNGFDDNNKPIPMHWQEFVEKPWTMRRSNNDNVLLEKKRKHPRQFLPCRNGMQYHEVVPCRFDKGTVPDSVVREQYPVYELKRGGNASIDEAYRNIMELRTDKIVNFLLEVPIMLGVGAYLAIRYEDMLQNGTEATLRQIGKLIGFDELPPTCQPQKPRPESLHRRQIPDGLRQWVLQHQNRDTERLLGYAV
mmetsp:Transcript_10070/g.28664  ORF Transcript_10070/g.28664 Transcript_10070/m.28664 type:complete len:426 (-) Transcript_10070:102-1379(-)